MSKYRVVIGESKMRRVFVMLAALVCLIPVWLVVSKNYSIVWFFQCVLSVGLIALARQLYIERGNEGIYLIEDNGAWVPLDERDANVWQISSGSRVSSFLLWVELSPKSPAIKAKKKWLWLFHDSVNKADFRRISRIIIRSHSASKSEASHYG